VNRQTLNEVKNNRYDGMSLNRCACGENRL